MSVSQKIALGVGFAVIAVIFVILDVNREPTRTPSRTPTSDIQIGDRARVTVSGLGCSGRSGVLHVNALLRAGDTVAANRYAQKNCRMVKPGDVTVFSANPDTLCVRPMGELDCFWVDRSRVAKGPKDQL